MLEILKVVNPNHMRVLRAPSCDAVVDPELVEFTNAMVDTMFAVNGAGLAAPQVGRNVNVFVMQTQKSLESGGKEALVVINPQILSTEGDTTLDQEGCLSIPGFVGDVRRHSVVSANYQDINGQPQSCILSGFTARCFQHEFDHLFGILYPDHAETMYKIRAKK